MIDLYRDWDGAYLLGSLSPSERREYEAHLAECSDCTASISQLAALPGLLSLVPTQDVEEEVEQPPVPATLLPRLVSAVQRRRRVRRLVTGLAAAAVAAAIVGVLVFPKLLPAAVPSADPGQPIAALTLSQVVASPLNADIRLIQHEWGTTILMTCRYGQNPNGYVSPAAYGMYVTDAAGTSTQLATWTAKPGSTVEPSGTTSLTLADIRSVDVRVLDSGEVLLKGSP
ncbi:MAG: zf-HC2 domain-containing protein [Terrimesophilobacter sp.]